MEFSNDELRRDARATEAEHAASINPMRNALNRVFGAGDDSEYTEEQKSQLVLSGLSRRRFLTIGGVSVLGATVLAACGSDAKKAVTTTTGKAATTTTGGGTKPMSMDVVILRTASSIEELAVAAYQLGIDSGLVKTPAVVDAAKLFQSQHKEHAQLFIGATTKAGGTPFTKPNPAVLASLQPTIKALKTEMDVVQLAYNLEVAAAETYQSNVGTFTDLTLNKAIMTVGGIEARHIAALAKVLNVPQVPKAFQVTDAKVAAGTGVS
jgi:hypothetical protein